MFMSASKHNLRRVDVVTWLTDALIIAGLAPQRPGIIDGAVDQKDYRGRGAVVRNKFM